MAPQLKISSCGPPEISCVYSRVDMLLVENLCSNIRNFYKIFDFSRSAKTTRVND